MSEIGQADRRHPAEYAGPSCPTSGALAAWIDQGLDASARAEVTAHLAGCTLCRAVILQVVECKRRELLWTRKPTTAVDRRVVVVFGFMRREMGQHLVVERLATRAGVSPSELRLLFEREIGLSPMRCLKYLRLERAGELLRRNRKSVKETAAAVGCRDDSHFVRDFEKHFGLSPARYRNQHLAAPAQRRKRFGQ